MFEIDRKQYCEQVYSTKPAELSIRISTMNKLLSFTVVALSFSTISASDLTDNPAFCYGLLSAHSQKEADELRDREVEIRALFARIGPKDSTDERGFVAWSNTGMKYGSSLPAIERKAFLTQCRHLLGSNKS